MAAHLDGNVLAGAMSELFAFDVTLATGSCASCGDRAELARAMVYGGAMGNVARCRVCGDVLLVVVETPRGVILNLRGVTALRVERLRTKDSAFRDR